MRAIRLIRLGVACFLIHTLASAQALPTAQPDEPLGHLAGKETRLCANADVRALATSANVVVPALRPPQTTAQQGVLPVLQLPPLQMRFNQTFRQSWWAYLACVLVLAASIAKGGIRHYADRVRQYRQTEWKPAAQPLKLDNAKTQLFGSVANDLHKHIRKIVINAKQGGSVKGIPELAQQMEQQAAVMRHLASQLAELGRTGAEKPHLATLSLPETPATACGLDASGSIRNTPKKPFLKAASTAHPVPLPSLNARHSAPDWQTGTGSIGLETPADREFLECFNREAEAHLADENFGVNKLLRELGTSRTRLHRKLKAATGQSAHELLRSIRMQKAMHLLRTTSLPVAEVAARVGFGSPSHFTKVFGEYFGSTPSATREQAAAA